MKSRKLAKFDKDFKKLDRQNQQRAAKKLREFLEDTERPSFSVKKMKGHEDIWEAHVTMRIVFTFEWGEIDGERGVIFRRIGGHDIYENP
jgi:mRNA-degrading endonuclease RelE of RelBE toxin-antitoxin system